jgi:cytochrome c-type biogenesis protein CcsB
MISIKWEGNQNNMKKLTLITLSIFWTGQFLFGQTAHFTTSGIIEFEKTANLYAIFQKSINKDNESYLVPDFEAFKKKDNPVSFEVGLTSTVATTTSTVNNYSKLSLLQTIDLWSYRIIGIGFPFLTIGIISGAVWANEAWGSYWSWDPKETWALITWLVFAIYLHSRLIKGWEGQKAAFLGSCGFFVIWICYLGVNFLGKGLHSYGWVL